MLLSLILFLPIIIAIIIAIFPFRQQIRTVAIFFSLVEIILGLKILKEFDHHSVQLQLVERYSWIEDFGIYYFIGVDGISLWLVLLTLFLQPIIILASWKSITDHIKGYYASLFILQTAMLGTFLSFDGVLFYVFWELSLVPMYFIIGLWGGEKRVYATVKFFIYTMAGSIMMLVAIVIMMLLTKDMLGSYSASLLDWYQLKIPFVGGDFLSPQTLLFFAFAIAFAVKTPAFPFHTWLPDAHVQAPTAGSVILAGVMLKMGTYGFLRWVIPLFPEATKYWDWVFMIVGVIGIIYGALMALSQTDIKKLIAYSSVSHMGYILMGLFSLNEFGINGALYQMLNHGISTGALFLLVGIIYERTHTRDMNVYGGIASNMPWYSIVFLIVTFSSIAVPLTNGFIGEFLILFGVYQKDPIWSYWAVTGVVLGASYMLWLVKKVFFGPPGPVTKDTHHPLIDLNLREKVLLSPFVLLIFWMGIFPNHFLNFSQKSLEYLVKNYQNYELNVNESEEHL